MIVEKCRLRNERESRSAEYSFENERSDEWFLELNPNPMFLDALITRDARGKIILGNKRYDTGKQGGLGR